MRADQRLHSALPRFSSQDIAGKIYAERWWCLAVILGVAAGLRFAGIGQEAIWVDEAFSIWFSDQSWQYLWSEVPKFENHPPYYFMLLKACRELLGSSEWALRLPSAVLSLASVALIFGAGRALGRCFAHTDDRVAETNGWLVGLLAAALAALSDTQIVYAQEVRPYSFATFAAALLLLAGLRIVGSPAPRAVDYICLGAGMVLTAWSHSLGVIHMGLTGLFLLAWWGLKRPRDMRLFRNLALTGAAVLLLLLPHIYNIVLQSARDYQDFWLAAPNRREFLTVNLQIFGQASVPGGLAASLPIAGLLILLGLFGLWRLTRSWSNGLWVCAYLTVIPFGFWAFVVGFTYLVTPVLMTRTLIYLQPFLFLIMASGIFVLKDGPFRPRLLFGVVAIAYFTLGLFQTSTVINFPRPFRDFALQIAESNDPKAPVMAFPDVSGLILGYYDRQYNLGLDIRPIPYTFPRLRDGLPDMISNEQFTQAEADAVQGKLEALDAFWLVERNSRYADPKNMLAGAVEAAGFYEKACFGGNFSRPATWQPAASHEFNVYVTLCHYKRP